MANGYRWCGNLRLVLLQRFNGHVTAGTQAILFGLLTCCTVSKAGEKGVETLITIFTSVEFLCCAMLNKKVVQPKRNK